MISLSSKTAIWDMSQSKPFSLH